MVQYTQFAVRIHSGFFLISEGLFTLQSFNGYLRIISGLSFRDNNPWLHPHGIHWTVLGFVFRDCRIDHCPALPRDKLFLR